jgi:hypothetical protein
MRMDLDVVKASEVLAQVAVEAGWRDDRDSDNTTARLRRYRFVVADDVELARAICGSPLQRTWTQGKLVAVGAEFGGENGRCEQAGRAISSATPKPADHCPTEFKSDSTTDIAAAASAVNRCG